VEKENSFRILILVFRQGKLSEERVTHYCYIAKRELLQGPVYSLILQSSVHSQQRYAREYTATGDRVKGCFQ